MRNGNKHQMVLVVPIYEVEMTAVLQTPRGDRADGRYLGKYRTTTISRIAIQGFWKSLVTRAMPGIRFRHPRLRATWCIQSVTTGISRRRTHFSRLNGAELSTSFGYGRLPFRRSVGAEQPAHAVGLTRISLRHHGLDEKPWRLASFMARVNFCNHAGKIVAQASRDKANLLVADLNLEGFRVRDTWQFYRDRGRSLTEKSRARGRRKTLRPRTDLAAVKWRGKAMAHRRFGVFKSARNFINGRWVDSSAARSSERHIP